MSIRNPGNGLLFLRFSFSHRILTPAITGLKNPRPSTAKPSYLQKKPLIDFFQRGTARAPQGGARLANSHGPQLLRNSLDGEAAKWPITQSSQRYQKHSKQF